MEPSPRGVVEGFAAAAAGAPGKLPEQGVVGYRAARGRGTSRMSVEWTCGRGPKGCGATEKSSVAAHPLLIAGTRSNADAEPS